MAQCARVDCPSRGEAPTSLCLLALAPSPCEIGRNNPRVPAILRRPTALPLPQAYNAGQLDVEFALEAGGTPEPAGKAPPKRKAAEPTEAPSEAPKAKRERQQPKQQQPKQQQQQQARRGKGEGAGLVVPSPQAPQHPPSRPRAKPRPGQKGGQEAGKAGKGAKAARPPSAAAGRGSRQDGKGAEARPPSEQRGKVRETGRLEQSRAALACPAPLVYTLPATTATPLGQLFMGIANRPHTLPACSASGCGSGASSLPRWRPRQRPWLAAASVRQGGWWLGLVLQQCRQARPPALVGSKEGTPCAQ